MKVKIKDIKDENLKQILLLYFSEDSEINVSEKRYKKNKEKNIEKKSEIVLM